MPWAWANSFIFRYSPVQHSSKWKHQRILWVDPCTIKSLSFEKLALRNTWRGLSTVPRSIYLTSSSLGGTGSTFNSWTYSRLFSLCFTFIDNWKRSERKISITFGVRQSFWRRERSWQVAQAYVLWDRCTGRLAKLPFLLHLDATRGVLFCLNRSSLQPGRLLEVIAHVLRFFAIGLYFLFLISPSVTILSSVE